MSKPNDLEKFMEEHPIFDRQLCPLCFGEKRRSYSEFTDDPGHAYFTCEECDENGEVRICP